MGRGTRRRGLTLTEALLALAVVGVLCLLVVLALPAQRENARLVACQRNLAQIGVALGHYATLFDDRLPPVSPLEDGGPGPLAIVLQTLGEADFSRLRPDLPPQAARDLTPIVEARLAGLVCPSDVASLPVDFPAPVSYRTNAGQETDGRDGPFAPGKTTTRAAVEAADGMAYTAAFAERLVGNGRPESSPVNYALAEGPIAASGCPDAPATSWKGDAGSSWARAGWVSTLYNHAQPPGAPRSCVAADGVTAMMGASSGHAGRVHVLLLDGSVRSYRVGVAPPIWKALGSVGDGAEAGR